MDRILSFFIVCFVAGCQHRNDLYILIKSKQTVHHHSLYTTGKCIGVSIGSMVVKSTATIAVTSESWDTDSPAGIVMVFSVPASEPDEVDAADAVDVLFALSGRTLSSTCCQCPVPLLLQPGARALHVFSLLSPPFLQVLLFFFVLSFHR